MASNTPSGDILPGVITDIVTQSRGVTVPAGSRIVAVIGEGSTDEVLVSQANGFGDDGLNSSYTSTTGSDGRHFRLSNYPVIAKRTTLYKNGIPLVGLESPIDSNAFSNKYDYRIDISTGKIELQKGRIEDQGGSLFVPLSTNVGDGYLTGLSLVDSNAQPETWTIRCVGVQRDTLNAPIAGTAKFIALGSISGQKLDANGNPIIWVANNTLVSNGIIKFAIYENSLTPFRDGDAFTVKVASGVLVKGDSLSANSIPEANLNDPVFLTMDEVVKKHGFPSLTNNLSLGAQLVTGNGATGVVCVQAAPSMPNRRSYVLAESVDALSTNDDDFIFALPVGVVPDVNSSIHFFVTDNTTGVENQLLPNKLDFYTLDTSGYPSTTSFINDTTPAPGGYSYFYTVKESISAINTGFDGYIGRNLAYYNQGVFSSNVTFDSTYVGKFVKVIDSANSANIGIFKVTSVSNGKLYIVADGTVVSGSVSCNPTYLSDFTNENPVTFEVIDPTSGLPVVGGSGTDGVLTKSVGTGTATMTSVSVNFGSITGISGFRVQINGSSNGNDGLYDITSSGLNTVTIKKALVNESGLRYEILDPSDVSQFVVVNRNVVPSGYGLRVTVVDTKEASFYDAGWLNALESLEKVECDILVPLPKQTISVIFQNALSHVRTMSNSKNKKERVLFIGAISGLTANNLSGTQDAAVEDIGVLEGIQGESITDVLAGNVEDLANYSVSSAYGGTFRCVYFYPDQIVVQVGSDNLKIDGFYIAAAAAGYLSSNIKTEDPLTMKVLSGFTILRDKQFKRSVLEQLALAGVTVLQPVSGGGRVVWGITTSQSGYTEEQEISIVFIRDRVAKSLRAGFIGYIGQAETADTPAILHTRAVQLLNSLIGQNLITDYKDLVVKRDDVNSTQWNIYVAVQPTYPINYIYIKVALGQL